MKHLRKDILSGPTFETLYPSRRFYINTYCYKDGIGEVLLQADVSEAQEKYGGKCELDKSLEGICI